MKYKGIELKEITEPQIFDPPKLMLVWDDYNGGPVKINVCAIVNREGNRVITDRTAWRHCAETPESKPVTYFELSQWLAKGNGRWRRAACMKMVYTNLSYDESMEDEPVDDDLLVRKWEDSEWVAPTREYLGLGD